MRTDYDLIIVGGGLAGNTLALALQATGLKLAIVEATGRAEQQASPAGDRALALAAGTVSELSVLGIWSGVADLATPITHIHISDRGHFGKTRLSAAHENVDALGYVITARDIETHVAERVAAAGIEQLCPARVVGLAAGAETINVSLKSGDASSTLTARLVVGADGGQSSVRQLLDIAQQVTEYRQTALVTTVATTALHHNTAYERFTASGPLAMLPVKKNHCAVVWTRSSEDADALMRGSAADFVAELQHCFGYKLGELTLTAPRRAFPLALIRAQHMTANRAVIIGNAAHQLHPVAGQGFNLGLRDVVSLADMLTATAGSGGDIGDATLLQAYADQRRRDHNRVIGFTDNVVKIFSNDTLPLAAARNIGLAVLDLLPGAKSTLAQQAMGFIG